MANANGRKVVLSMPSSCQLPRTQQSSLGGTFTTVRAEPSKFPGRVTSKADIAIEGYTEIINLLDYSSVAISVTRADKSVDVFDKEYTALNDTDRENWKACSCLWNEVSLELANRSADDPDTYDGAPVGLQIVGRGLQEERTLSIACIAYAALQATSEVKVQ